MGWTNEIKKFVKHATTTNIKERLPGKDNRYSILGAYQRGQDDKKAAAREAELQRQAQLDILAAQKQNALADLKLDNTPDIIAGGTADALLSGSRRKRRTGNSQSIATQLGL